MLKVPFRKGWLAKYALDEAKRGNPGPLIGRFLNHSQLSGDETRFIIEALESTGGKRQADELREIEQFLIAEQVEDFMTENGLKQEAAIKAVMDWRGRSRRHVFNALKAYRAKRRRS